MVSGSTYNISAAVQSWTESEAGDGDIRLVGYDNINVLSWLAEEVSQNYQILNGGVGTPVGAAVVFTFDGRDDAFRFRMRFDEALASLA